MKSAKNKYKRYPEYKPSGLPWIGSIPSHWEKKPAFALAHEKKKKKDDGSESNALSLSYGSIIKRNVETNFGLLPETFNTYQVVKKGDIILRLTDLQNDKRSLRSAQCPNTSASPSTCYASGSGANKVSGGE